MSIEIHRVDSEGNTMSTFPVATGEFYKATSLSPFSGLGEIVGSGMGVRVLEEPESLEYFFLDSRKEVSSVKLKGIKINEGKFWRWNREVDPVRKEYILFTKGESKKSSIIDKLLSRFR